jgi:hypothetical protein
LVVLVQQLKAHLERRSPALDLRLDRLQLRPVHRPHRPANLPSRPHSAQRQLRQTQRPALVPPRALRWCAILIPPRSPNRRGA